MQKSSFRYFAAAVATLSVLSFFPALASAETISVNFETPTYTLGVINAQDGWSSLGAAGLGCAVYDHAVNSSLSTPGFGGQSLRISNAVVSGCFGDQTFAKPLTNAVGEAAATAGAFSVGTLASHFESEFALASAVPGAQQPDLYLSVSPDRGDGSRMSYLRFEDQPDGIHAFFDDVTSTQTPNSDQFNETDIATLNRSTPHVVKFVMDMVNGPSNDVVKVYIDGVLKITGTSWEDYYRYDSEAAAEQSPRIIKTLLFRTGGGTNYPALSGNGFLVDNLSLQSGPVLLTPTDKNQCKKDGWQTFNNPVFKNQGQCVKFVETGK